MRQTLAVVSARLRGLGRMFGTARRAQVSQAEEAASSEPSHSQPPVRPRDLSPAASQETTRAGSESTTSIESQFVEDESERHDRLYREGWGLLEGELILDGRRPGWLSPASRSRLQRAIVCFESVLEIAPSNWAALWALGKIHQRLGDLSQALASFARAHAIDPSRPDVAREAGITATQLGDGQAALRYSKVAISLAPGDTGLVANLALALLITGDVEGAQAASAEACARAPDDVLSRTARGLVDDVATGRRPFTCGRDLGLAL